MNALFIALVVVLGLLCCLNILLTIGVVKRLRAHSDMLAQRGGPSESDVPVGLEVGEFAAVTLDGEEVGRDDLADDCLVAFFMHDCSPCREKMPRFVEYAKKLPGGRNQTLVVVDEDGGKEQEFAAALAPVARVVVTNGMGPVAGAFKVSAFPTMLRVARDELGQVRVSANSVDLDQPVGALI
ncbi:TlpA family protein disulfide reductase [Streptomyces sp. CA-132043]|uniref:TlpA family protein disulfide reductase n=1 Tax=Streptomyces sp. CA-132043 TaxID=3240048 RepID=UPI003D946B55